MSVATQRGTTEAVLRERDNSRYYRTDRAVRSYTSYDELKSAEPAILAELVRDGLAEQRLLDLGVGGGRTSVHFAPVAGEYHGVDYSAPLVAACRERFADRDWPHVDWGVGDARALDYPDGRFDVVLFSWNGLDAVGGEDDRLRALREIRRVLVPGGRFFFSAHNLEYAVGGGRLKARLVRRLLNPGLPRHRESPFALIADERVGLRWESHYYIRPAAQLEQLRETGFTEAAALQPDGTRVPEPRRGEFATVHWLYYGCRA